MPRVAVTVMPADGSACLVPLAGDIVTAAAAGGAAAVCVLPGPVEGCPLPWPLAAQPAASSARAATTADGKPGLAFLRRIVILLGADSRGIGIGGAAFAFARSSCPLLSLNSGTAMRSL
ncbi:MAG TPA: hypothetical protein VGH53_06710 [Streptosporangiaceae bacterium]